MKKLLTSFFALTLSFGVFAQNVSGYVRSENGEGVPFVSIYLKGKNIGITSNIDGHYILPSSILTETNDTLIFSSIGFETQKISVPIFKQRTSAGQTNIVLKTNSILLAEVVIRAKNHKPKDYGLFHLRSAPARYDYLFPSSRVMVFVENTDGTDKIIQTVNIRMSCRDTDRSKHPNKDRKLRVFFYQKTESGFQNIKVADDDILITDFSKIRIRHDVSKYRIPFPKEGIYVGFEWVGETNVIQERSRGREFGLSVTDKAKKPHSWVFIDEKWEQHPVEMYRMAIHNPYYGSDFFNRLHETIIQNSNFQIGITAY
ncbi:MAG: carboxypeptidase-like regulatory domain-containing protein [Bacteroidales bacterium]|nr:carboxypeptidase-like regulatory domain-containing protein [Bacteroidales bacterium]